MILFALLPGTFMVLLWRWLCLRGFGMREALLAANIINGVLVVFATEALTVVQQLHFATLFLFWFAVSAVVIAGLARIPGAFRWSFPRIEWAWIEGIFLAMAAFIVLVVGFIALYAPPNTWDAMTYHMSRVAHWQQNNGVMNYPTNIIRQLVIFPFAEYVILHLQVLGGSDRFANMVQWGALVLSATGASLIARELGLDRRGQIVTALLALTLPMAILQGSSTQNDLVVTFLLVSVAFFVLKARQEDKRRWVLLTAASAGLAVLAKGTGFLMAMPFIFMSLFFSAVDIRRKALLLGAVLAAVLVFTGPFMLRLTEIDRNPVAAMEKVGKVSVDRPGVVGTVSNGIRNLFMEMALPSQDWNRRLEGLSARFHEILGIDENDPGTTFDGKFGLTFELDEDVAVNPLHATLVLIAACCFWFCCAREKVPRWYAVTLGVVVLLFCMTVKWQPWVSRFHLPMFVLFMPVVAAVGQKILPRRIFGGVVIVAFLISLYPLFLNNTRPLLSAKNIFARTREQGYFSRDISAFPVVSKIATTFKGMGCREVGLRISPNEWEYTWQVMLGQDARVEHVGVEGDAAAFAYPRGEFHPCAVIDMVDPGRQGVAVFNGRPFVKAAQAPTLALYLDPAYRR